MSPSERFEQALKAEQPLECLREAVRGLLARGYERQAVLAELESFRGLLQEGGRDEDEDIVLEVMDFLVGWSSPHMAL